VGFLWLVVSIYINNLFEVNKMEKEIIDASSEKVERKLKIPMKGIFFSWRDLTFLLAGALISAFICIMLVV